MKDPRPPPPPPQPLATPSQAYEPPRVRRIEIAVEEAIMAICKGSVGGGPYGPGCGGCRGGGS